jgi:HSP20 family molecular chaperone IbpA
MKLNEVATRLRDTIRHHLGQGTDRAIRVAEQDTPLERLSDAPVVTPPIDVYENHRELVIYADVPGASREGTRVAWDGNRGLTFAVKREALPASTPWTSEYEPGEWYRSLQLPEYTDGSRAMPSIKDGVLTIRIPKRATASKRIPVRTG